MEKEHRDAIQKTFSSLVEQTDLDLMVSTLFEKGVFSDPMIEPYKDTSKDTRTRKRQLYRDITRRGPHAFNHLLDALMENGYWDLVRELDPHSALHPSTASYMKPGPSHGSKDFLSIFDKKRKNTGKEQEDPNTKQSTNRAERVSSGVEDSVDVIHNAGNFGEASGSSDALEIPHFNVIKSTKFFEDDGSDIKLYRTRGRNRGVLVVFSYVEFQHNIETYRAGAEQDAKNLKYLFTELGFKVVFYLNLSLEETKNALEKLKNGLCAEGPETVFVVFSSHGYPKRGTGDTDIRCSDGHLISYFEIIDYFNNVRFPALQGIPKVFIFQICRGTSKELHAPRHLREPSPRRAGGRRGRRGRPRGAGGARTQQDGTVYEEGSEESCSEDEDGDKRMYSDIIIANSTVPGDASNRDTNLGSWYIQALCSVFAARAHDCHVVDLFTLVDEQLRKRFRTQTSSVDRWGFNRHLYLHPGLYED